MNGIFGMGSSIVCIDSAIRRGDDVAARTFGATHDSLVLVERHTIRGLWTAESSREVARALESAREGRTGIGSTYQADVLRRLDRAAERHRRWHG